MPSVSALEARKKIIEHPQLLSHGHFCEFITYPDVYSEEDLDTMHEDELDPYLLRDYANARYEEETRKYPDNQFRCTSRVQSEGSGGELSLFFETFLTDEGQKALKYSTEGLSIDSETGEVDYNHTVETWLWRIHQMTPTFYRLGAPVWINEEWATPIREAQALMHQGAKITPEGKADIDQTARFWARKNNYLAHKNELLSINAEWAVPLQEEIMLLILKENRRADDVWKV